MININNDELFIFPHDSLYLTGQTVRYNFSYIVIAIFLAILIYNMSYETILNIGNKYIGCLIMARSYNL